MPYINQNKRNRLDPLGTETERATTTGELNYQFTRLAVAYVEGNGLGYDTINDVLGAFDGASKEFYRRVATPYEDAKMAQNGDVYGL